MGVKGLLPLLKSIHKPCSLKQFAGQTLGVDAYGWLHRGTIACAIELAQGRATTKFVDFAMHRVRMLVHFGVKPFLVFDGDYLPSKKHTEKERAARRKQSRAAGLDLLRMGKSQQAQLELQKSIDVTPEMARQFMDELERAKIDFIVAPYEADSQLVYLEGKGIIHGIISEDSDMLVFGAETLLTKLDQYGECVAIHRKDLTSCKELSFVGWTDEEFRWMSILSGCDYLEAVGNVGLKTAYRLIRKHKTPERSIKALQFDGKSKVAPDYLEKFRRADLTFLHQWVYCPIAQDLVNIKTPPEDLDISTLDFIGRRTDAATARAVSRGVLDPHTKEPYIATSVGKRFGVPLQKFMQQRQTPELKKHHSIESFFKAKRTPLAELDPNVFTPSPSQQRLLEQQQQESRLDVTPARPAPAVRAVSDVVRNAQARRAFGELSAHSGRQTSPKRQRLCSDIGIASALKEPEKATPAHSRFFYKPAISASPSVIQASRKENKRKKPDFSIWSDDSIEEAMLQLPVSSLDSHCSVPSVPRIEQGVTELTTIPSALCENDSQTAIGLQTNATGTTTVVLADTTLANSAGLLADSQASLSKAMFAETLNDNIDDIVPSSSPPKAAIAILSTQDPILDDEGINDEDWRDAASQPLVVIKPLSMQKELSTLFAGVRPTLGSLAGSEDMLVPNSDSEEEASHEPEVLQAQSPLLPALTPLATSGTSFGLDLGRFAFAG